MEVEGKRDGDITSVKSASYLCHPCGDEGKQNEATGFCQNCQEYLCEDCCEYHRKVRVTKSHIIIDKNKMPQGGAETQPAAICTEKCKQHKTEIVKFFCKEHDFVGCGDCIIIGHKQCKVDHIQELGKGFLESKEYRELLRKLDDIQSKISSKRDELKKKKAAADEFSDKTISDIREFRLKINEYLNKAEQKLLESCFKMKKEIDTMIQQQDEQLKTVEGEIGDIMRVLKSKEANLADLFVEAKRAVLNLRNLEEESACSVMEGQSTGEISFHKNDTLKNILSQEGIGSLSVNKQNIADMTPILAWSINVKSSSNKRTCYIASMVLTPAENILCTDHTNKSVKVIDVKTNQLSCELFLSSGPWNIRAVTDTDLYATSLPDENKIQFIRFGHNLSKLGFISTNGECRGIAYYDQKLIVTFVNPAKIQVLSLQGKVVLTVDSKAMFDWPEYVAVDHREAAVYISDYKTHCVVKMTMTGSILATYKDEDFKHPEGMFVCTEGNMLVCRDNVPSDGNFDSIYMISANCKRVKILLQGDSSMRRPRCICFDERRSYMYIGTFSSDMVLVYKMQ